jgi:hypothetical protein
MGMVCRVGCPGELFEKTPIPIWMKDDRKRYFQVKAVQLGNAVPFDREEGHSAEQKRGAGQKE